MMGKVLFFRGKGKFSNFEGYSTSRRRVFRNRFLSRAYRYFLLFDYSLQIFSRIGIPLMFNRRIVCDRYVHDTVVDIGAGLSLSKEEVLNLLKRFSFFLPKPDIVFLMDAPAEVAYQRKDDIPSLVFLTERRQIYLDIAKGYEMPILDGSWEPERLRALIQAKLGEVTSWLGQ